ncbi:MAG: hypothetical protein M1119_09595 [Firmicutes bacterium]|nr:hypothetical protein [Bacillota bacterium]
MIYSWFGVVHALSMARTSNAAKGLSTAHLVIGVVVIVLAVILSEPLES